MNRRVIGHLIGPIVRILPLIACLIWNASPSQAQQTAAAPVAVPPAAAAPAASGLVGGGTPIEITADEGLEWHQDAKAYVARGNAVAVRGQMTLKGAVLTAFYRDLATGGTEIFRVAAEGAVSLTAPNQSAFGERALYDIEKDVAVLTGNGLRFVTPNDVVTARDSLEYWRTQKLAVARGDALAVRGDNRVRADQLVGLLENDAKGQDTLSRIDATGSVVITTPGDVARGNRGTYDIARKLAVLRGDVKITRGKSQLNGSEAEVDLQTGISRMLAGPAAEQGRVRGLFVPGQPAGKGKTP
jgi:lipopolysaccharide export system protein LptA